MEIAIGIAALLATILAAAFAYFQGRPSKKLAEAQLQRAAPPSVGAFGRRSETIVFIAPWQQNLPIMTYLNLSFANESDITIHSVNVIVDMPEMLLGPAQERAVAGHARILKMERYHDFSEGQGRTKIYYAFDHIHPKVDLQVQEIIFFPITSDYKSKVNATTKDGVNVDVNVSLELWWSIGVTVSSADADPVTKNFRLCTYKRTNPMVSGIFEPNKAEFTLRKANWDPRTGSEVNSTAVVWKSSTPFPAEFAGVPMEEKFRHHHPDDAEVLSVTYFPKIGFLPVRRVT